MEKIPAKKRWEKKSNKKIWKFACLLVVAIFGLIMAMGIFADDSCDDEADISHIYDDEADIPNIYDDDIPHIYDGETDFPRIEKVMIEDDKLVSGKIDKYPITIYLEFEQIFDLNSGYYHGIYSVEGWYFYDRIRTKIPLTGLYYHYSDLILYNFSDTTKSNKLLHLSEDLMEEYLVEEGLIEEALEGQDLLKFYRNLSGYQEKFTLTDSENYWTNNNKRLDVSIDLNDFSVDSHEFFEEYLILDSTTTFDLHTFGVRKWNFKIVAHKENNFILQYGSSSTSIMGNCGAGTERGFFQVQFDKNNKLIGFEEFIYGSCNRSILCSGSGVVYQGNQKEMVITDKVTTCNCKNYEGELYDLIMNLNTLKITKVTDVAQRIE